MAEFMRGFQAGFPDMRHTIRYQIAEAGQVATAFSFKGTHTANLIGVPASGKVVEFTGIAIHRIEDGIIVEAETGFDMFNLMKQIGAMGG